MEKTSTNHASNDVLISKRCRELIQLNNKKINPDSKMERGPEQTFFQRRYADGQQVTEKKLSITYHQRNTCQNHNEIPLHTDQNDYHKNDNK